MEQTSLTISIVALIVSLTTFWLTRIRKGTVKMTKPTVIFFGPDGPGADLNKVFIRTLLYSTSDKGQYIENMFVKLTRGETVQNFNVWVYGDKHDGLSRGSGLFVGKNGLASNHHFLMPKDGSNFYFTKGSYELDVYVEMVNKKPQRIYTQNLTIDDQQGRELADKKAGIYFDWAPNTQTYQSHIDNGPKKIPDFVDLLNHLES
jgi:hypothetical protein